MELVIIRGAAFSPKETVSSVINPLRLNWNVTSFFDKGTLAVRSLHDIDHKQRLFFPSSFLASS